jgi:hypothetical protein
LEKRCSLKQHWENWISTYRILKLDLCISPCTKINSKCTTNLNIRLETLKLLEENVRKILENIGTGNAFLNRTPIVQKIRARIDEWGCIK